MRAASFVFWLRLRLESGLGGRPRVSLHRLHDELERQLREAKDKFAELEKEDVQIKNDYKQLKQDVKKLEKQIEDDKNKVHTPRAR